MITRISRVFLHPLRFDPVARAEHDYHNVFLKGREDIISLCPRPLPDADLLILGCGYAYPEVILYAPLVRSVVGLDVMAAFYRDGLRARVRDIRRRGGHPLQAVLQALVERYKYARYYRHLARISGVPIHHEAYTLLTYDGLHMPLADEHFDVVMSNAVLEHVTDIHTLVRELHRVTRPGGISYHLWHNYYSLSGGHVPPALYTRQPWGHLRGLYATRGVNRLRPDEITRAFSRYFRVLTLYHVDAQHAKKERDSDFEYEGKALLTPEIRQELSEYPEELLLTRAFLIVARKES